MKRLRISVLVAISVAGLLLIAGCTQAPPPAPTAAPAKPAATTAPAAPTAAPAAPTAAPKAAEPTKPAAPTAAAAPKVTWPEKGKAITVIVGYAAGGPNDLVARVLAPEMEKVLGTPVQVVNKAGANEQIASTELVRAKPDGYTLQLQTPTIISVSYLDAEAKAVFSRKDFAPIAIVEGHSSAMLSNPASPYKNMKDVVDAAKAAPEKITYASSGLMTTGAFTAYALQEVTGAKFAVVNTQSGTNSLTAVLGGHADFCQANTNVAVSQVKGGTLLAIATTGAERNSYLPDVPTIKEQGYNVVSETNLGLVAPAATPKEIQEILQNTMKTVMTNEAVKKKLVEMYSGPMYLDTAGYNKLWDESEIAAKTIIEKARKQ